MGLSFWLYNGFVEGEVSTQLEDYGATQGEAKASLYTTSSEVSLDGEWGYTDHYVYLYTYCDKNNIVGANLGYNAE